MANMAKRIQAGEYQIGIWNVERAGRQWRAVAIGPGTVADGSPMVFPTLAAAHLQLTGEAMREADQPSGTFRFMVPVYVTVEDGLVSAVKVDDSYPPTDQQADAHRIDGAPLHSLLKAALAGRVWPAWEFGW